MIRGVTDTNERPQVMDNSSATVMLGLEGMAVLAVSERDGELEYAIETTASTGWCPVCGAAARLHGRRPTWVRDLPAGDHPVTLPSSPSSSEPLVRSCAG